MMECPSQSHVILLFNPSFLCTVPVALLNIIRKFLWKHTYVRTYTVIFNHMVTSSLTGVMWQFATVGLTQLPTTSHRARYAVQWEIFAGQNFRKWLQNEIFQMNFFADAGLLCRRKTQLCLRNSQISFSRMLGQPLNLRKFCPMKISHYTVRILSFHLHNCCHPVWDARLLVVLWWVTKLRC